VADFIDWIKQQDFFENTTIVLCGDHLTQDSMYAEREGLTGYDRRTYTAIINPAPGVSYTGEGRQYTTLDLYPTTLAAMGVEIEGDRLGLGVNLYSDTPTLVEEYGNEYLNIELMKNSKLYKNKLLYK
jgi:phosphoglycerol transferase